MFCHKKIMLKQFNSQVSWFAKINLTDASVKVNPQDRTLGGFLFNANLTPLHYKRNKSRTYLPTISYHTDYQLYRICLLITI